MSTTLPKFHPEQQPHEIYLGNFTLEQMSKPNTWLFRRIGLIAYACDGQLIDFGRSEHTFPVFLPRTEVEAAVHVARNKGEDERADVFQELLDLNRGLGRDRVVVYPENAIPVAPRHPEQEEDEIYICDVGDETFRHDVGWKTKRLGNAIGYPGPEFAKIYLESFQLFPLFVKRWEIQKTIDQLKNQTNLPDKLHARNLAITLIRGRGFEDEKNTHLTKQSVENALKAQKGDIGFLKTLDFTKEVTHV